MLGPPTPQTQETVSAGTVQLQQQEALGMGLVLCTGLPRALQEQAPANDTSAWHSAAEQHRLQPMQWLTLTASTPAAGGMPS